MSEHGIAKLQRWLAALANHLFSYGDELSEKRVRPVRTGREFRMELRAKHERVPQRLGNLDQ